MVDVYVVDVQYKGEDIDGVYSACVQIFGRRSTGESVCVTVRGFRPYFYCLAPDASQCSADTAARAIVLPLRTLLDERAAEMQGKEEMWTRRRGEQLEIITVSAVAVRRTAVMHYQTECEVLRITCSHPYAIPLLRDAILAGKIGWTLGNGAMVRPGDTVFEANLDFVLRFMTDNNVRCNAWIHIPNPVEDDNNNTACTSPSLICDCPGEITAYTDQEEKAKNLVPSLTVISFDIECDAEKGKFPDPTVDTNAVIQIACDLTKMDGRKVAEIEASATSVLLALNTTDPDVVGRDVDVRCYYDEKDLLTAFAKYIRTEADPDVLTSWNGPNFDWKYIISRCEYLGISEYATRFSRIAYHKTRNREVTKSTKAFGTTKDNEVDIPGRTIFDLLVPVRKNYKLRSYKLDAVAEKYLKERKDNIKHTEISELWHGTAETRGTLGHYCMQDARLPRRLMLNRQLWTQYAEMARVCRVPTNYLVTRGEQIKVFTQLCHKAQQRGFIVDTITNKPRAQQSGAVDDAAADGDREVAYQGATVIEPSRGFYAQPIATLDFASLYPSIMRCHNLCYTTYVPRDRLGEFDAEDVIITPTDDIFVKAHIRKGLLPDILEELGKARTAAKTLMYAAEDAGDAENQAVYDKRQQAIKVSMNSVYGFTGVTFGKLPLQAIARSVTAYGRIMIEKTKAKVEEVGPPGTEVIYGDTDSVMIKYPCSVAAGADGKLVDVKTAIAEARDFALAGASAVNEIFGDPIKLEYEKVFYPYLLISKKRYAGGYFEKPADERMYLATKGIESQRRDNAQMVPRILDDVLTCLMDDLSPDRAILTAIQAVRAIVDGPVDADDIIKKISLAVHTAAEAGGCPNYDLCMNLHEELTKSYRLGEEKALTPHMMKEEWCQIAVDHSGGPNGEVYTDAAAIVNDVLRCNVTRADHVMSKAFSRPLEKYKDALPHTEVLKNMAKRADSIAMCYRKYLGDRIDYIIIAPCKTRQETYDEWVRVDSSDPAKRRNCTVIGVEQVQYPVDEDDPSAGVHTFRVPIMGRKKRTKRTSDRAEDPEWAAAHEHVPDAMYYIEKQLVNPISRLLKSLVGSKEEAIRSVLKPVARIVRPQRGFYPSRFDPDTKDALGIQKKRKITPVAQERKERKEWEKVKSKEEPKRARKVGPMDAFMRQ